MRQVCYSETARMLKAYNQPLPQATYASWCAMTQEQRTEFYSLVNKFLERDGKEIIETKN